MYSNRLSWKIQKFTVIHQQRFDKLEVWNWNLLLPKFRAISKALLFLCIRSVSIGMPKSSSFFAYDQKYNQVRLTQITRPIEIMIWYWIRSFCGHLVGQGVRSSAVPISIRKKYKLKIHSWVVQGQQQSLIVRFINKWIRRRKNPFDLKISSIPIHDDSLTEAIIIDLISSKVVSIGIIGTTYGFTVVIKGFFERWNKIRRGSHQL